jgi:hypothetical protein
MRRLLVVTLLAIVLLAVAQGANAQGANAQRMGSKPSHFAPTRLAPTGRGPYPRSSFYPLVFYDSFYSDYVSSTGYPVASQPPVIILQAPPAAAPAPEPPSALAQPLMIELRGDRYVQVSTGESAAEPIDHESIDRPIPPLNRQPRGSDSAIRAAASSEPVTAILVFRDGHREEVSSYTIADGILYARADYYSEGTWNKKIPLSSLNLAETVNSNGARGVRFQLPTAPNEVIVSP